jgi:hypothetical protein
LSLEEITGYLNHNLAERMGGQRPLQYVDVDDAELAEYPELADAVRAGTRVPFVVVGSEVKTPASIGIYWIEEQLRELGVEPFATVEAKGGD